MTTEQTTDVAASPRLLGVPTLTVLAVAVGAVAGGGAVVFRMLIGLVHNLLFLGRISAIYNANVHTPPGPWGAGIIAVPVLGAVAVAWLVKNFAPEARGHGVPEVMEAVYYGKARIRPIVAAVKTLASGISIGSGGSVGREGPIVQIGSAFGSTLGQIVRMPVSQRATLIAAGAGGGIAATFNTPLGGFAFAVELILPSTNAATVLPVGAACVTATYIGQIFLGAQPAFAIPPNVMGERLSLDPEKFLLFVVLGVLLGLLATLFIRSIYWMEDRFNAMRGNYYTRHMLGMALVGLVMYGLMRTSGHYHVQGVGYATIEDLLHGRLTAPGFLLLLVAMKLLVTSLTLGSGASGGIFSPSLFLGAALGGCFGVVVGHLLPGLDIGVPAFAMVGMAGMMAGATGAVITSVTMLFEMTRDYNVVLPVVFTVGFAYVVRKRLSAASIYTMKNLRRGRFVPEGLEAALDSARTARFVMSDDFVVLPAEGGLQQLTTAARAPAGVVVLERGGRVASVLLAESPEGGEGAGAEPTTTREARHVFVGEHARMRGVLADVLEGDAEVALVTRSPGSDEAHAVIGVITTKRLGRLAREDSELRP